MEFSIYKNTLLIAIVSDASPKRAWQRSRTWVRMMAHLEGKQGVAVEYPRGRVSYQCGEYRAINSHRLDSNDLVTRQTSMSSYATA